jgi:hypothetical protein
VRDRLHQVQFDQLLGQQAQRPAPPARGRVGAGQGHQVRFDFAIDLAGQSRHRLGLQGGLQALLDEPLAEAFDGADGEGEGRGDVGIFPADGLVGLEQRLGVAEGAGSGFALGEQLLELVAFVVGQGHHILLHGSGSFRIGVGRYCRRCTRHRQPDRVLEWFPLV